MAAPDAVMTKLDELLQDARKHADDMAFEEGSGRGYPEPSEDLNTTLAAIRALVLDALTTPEPR